MLALGFLAALLFGAYMNLGSLRFFANHYLGLTFFSKHYLVLLQNNYELRPGGGFISAYGTVNTILGIPTGFSFHNSYEVDTSSYQVPPFPHEALLKNEWYQGYTFRDANWEPHFPDSAKALKDFYLQKFPDREVDGIAVINLSLLERLLDRLGGVTVLGRQFDGGNLFRQLEFEVNNVDRHSETALNERKSIVGDLADAVFSKAKWHPFAFRQTLEEGLKTKDLFFWFAGAGLERGILERGWGGALEVPEGSDLVAMNLANLGSKKADRYVEKEIHHFVNLAGEMPEMTTEVTLRFPGGLNAYSDDYKGYLRLYFPLGATLAHMPADSHEEVANGLKGVGNVIKLPAGGKTTLSYTYTLPRGAFGLNRYQLRLWRQPGSDARALVTVEGPAEGGLLGEGFVIRENRAFANVLLDRDMDFALRLSPDTTPPYPIEQVFDELNKIRVLWNEPVDATLATDTANYTVTDADVQEAGVSDTVTVKAVERPAPNQSVLILEGVSAQPLERYRLLIKNQRDLSGNDTLPAALAITAVQRLPEPKPL